MPLFSDLACEVADPFLRRAFGLAERGRGDVSPNPLVGCVIVRDGAVVGEGFHHRAGGAHAEILALAQAGDQAHGAHAYVTLEPCAHFGRTPPCVPALLKAGIAGVRIGMPDPNPAVTGGGARWLAESGVAVTWADDPGPFRRQNEAWLARLRTGRPWIRVKVALTLDGHPALFAGKRARVTGAGGRQVTMRLRAMSTGVAVGAATLAIDDPSLAVRDEDDVPADRQPQRFVLGQTSVPDAGAAMFCDGRGTCTVVVADATPAGSRHELTEAGVRVLTYAQREGTRGMLEAIAAAGVDDLLIEAGPSLFSALWHEGLIDELVVVTAGGTAGSAAPPLYTGASDVRAGVVDAVLRPIETGIVGDDLVSVWRPRMDSSVGSEKGSA